ncbi:MAG: tRNA (5-methylaminomethyl-2-thiouridine)(34)-methyltransferase MnmD [Pseudomonadota bacterium]
MSDLEWKENTLPVSSRFDDPYYSASDGRAETDHVFLQANDLPNRWPAMQSCTIAELGFGTGLNFLETVRQWREHKPYGAQLHFISFEQFPITPAEMHKALSVWPELNDLRNRLVDIWERQPALVDVDFTPDTHLTIHIGDANNLLPKQNCLADAWYLDGFSPAKNPELWNENLMNEVGKHTVAGGTFATYTAAGFVRRSLQAAGFEVSKAKGFGSKREMLRGTKPDDIHVADRH